MAHMGTLPKKPDGTEGYASITLTLKKPYLEIKTIACIIKNDETLQREIQSDEYVTTHKKTKFFLYFYCSESDLSNRLVESRIITHRFTKPHKDKDCIIENKKGTKPLFLRDNHVFLPACHKDLKTNDFTGFLETYSKAVTLSENLSVGKYRGVQNSNAPVEYLRFSLSSSNSALNITEPAGTVFQNLVDGPLLFEEASWRLIGWYKKAPEGDRITVYHLGTQDTTDIWKTSTINQTDASSQTDLSYEDLSLMKLHEEERVNFFQLTLLLFRDGNQKLREFFKSQWPVVYQNKTGTPPPSPVWTDIPNDATEMNKIETKPLKFHFNDQKVNFNTGDTNTWDFSLIATVLNNSTLKFVSPSTPESNAIKELKQIRNELIGHAPDAKIPTAVFNTEWPKACNALKTFGVTQDDIDQVKKDVKKPVNELLPFLNKSLKVEKEILHDINKLEKTIKDQHRETRRVIQQENSVVIETIQQEVRKVLKRASITPSEHVPSEDVAESGSSHVHMERMAIETTDTDSPVTSTRLCCC